MSIDIENICHTIRYHHRQRDYAMEQRKRADLALGSFLRLVLGWSKDGDSAANEAARKLADDLITIGEKFVKNENKAPGKRIDVEGADHPAFVEFRDLIVSSIRAREPFDTLESVNTKRMEKLAESLPVWERFGDGVKGFGARSLAVIVGEAGNLSNYPAKGHLWKRMGVAVIDGVRQGGPKNATKEDWIHHGYNRKRRSKMHIIGECLIRGENSYRGIYASRKAYEVSMAQASGLIVAPAKDIKKPRAAEFISQQHIHLRAQRYMEQKFLRDLRGAWIAA